MVDLTRLPPDATVDTVIEVIERDGGVIIEDFLSQEVMEEIKADLLPKLEKVSGGDDDFLGFKTRRMSALFAKTRRMADILTHPLYLQPAERIVNKPISYWSGDFRHEVSPGIRVGATQLIQIGPGEGAQILHRDDWAFMWRHPLYGREARLQIMLAVSDFKAENGGTLVIPGSHKWDDERVPDISEAISTEMKSGSALLFVGSLYHGGGTNQTTDEYRTGLTMTLDAANVRQEENMYLSLSPDVVASYPEEVQRLLGWASHKDFKMGWVEVNGHFADPIELLPKSDGARS